MILEPVSQLIEKSLVELSVLVQSARKCRQRSVFGIGGKLSVIQRNNRYHKCGAECGGKYYIKLLVHNISPLEIKVNERIVAAAYRK